MKFFRGFGRESVPKEVPKERSEAPQVREAFSVRTEVIPRGDSSGETACVLDAIAAIAPAELSSAFAQSFHPDLLKRIGDRISALKPTTVVNFDELSEGGGEFSSLLGESIEGGATYLTTLNMIIIDPATLLLHEDAVYEKLKITEYFSNTHLEAMERRDLIRKYYVQMAYLHELTHSISNKTGNGSEDVGLVVDGNYAMLDEGLVQSEAIKLFCKIHNVDLDVDSDAPASHFIREYVKNDIARNTESEIVHLVQEAYAARYGKTPEEVRSTFQKMLVRGFGNEKDMLRQVIEDMVNSMRALSDEQKQELLVCLATKEKDADGNDGNVAYGVNRANAHKLLRQALGKVAGDAA